MPLQPNYIPLRNGHTITREDLIENYTPEPDVYANKVLPALRKLKQSIARGERHREDGEFNAAEFEFESALDMDEENARATFGLGLTYMDWGKLEQAKEVFDKLIKLEGAFEPEHKHLFNEFGIKLRKNDMLEQALKYYAKAQELCSQDEHLQYNIARTLYAMGETAKAANCLRKALFMNPTFEDARVFLDYIQSKPQQDNEPGE